MSPDKMLEGQRLQVDRYSVVPRTISFIFHQDSVLLIEVAEDRGAWAGKYNGVGGHIEQGENPHTSALREIEEETGVKPDLLQFCGHIIIDTRQSTGIGLFVFGGSIEQPSSELKSSLEGSPRWVDLNALDGLPLVDDLHWLIPKVRASMNSSRPFLGLYRFDQDGKLVAQWVP